jgi:hypothetical protein
MRNELISAEITAIAPPDQLTTEEAEKERERTAQYPGAGLT